MDVRSVHSYEDSSDSENLSDGEFNMNIEIFLIKDENLFECIDLELIKKQKKLSFNQFEELINQNNFFENKMIRIIAISQGEEKALFPLNAAALILSQLA